MARINKGRTAVVFGGIILAVLFWVFCISFTVAMITRQNSEADNAASTRETVIVYVDDNSQPINENESASVGQTEAQKPTTNMDKYYMIDKNGNYVIGTGAYVDR